jgi:sec-independent protein translocase protein TatA
MNISSLVESTSTLAFGFGGGWEIMIVGGIALLMFGNRLPGAAKSLGMSFTAFKKGIKEGEEDLDDSSPSSNVESKSPPE